MRHNRCRAKTIDAELKQSNHPKNGGRSRSYTLLIMQLMSEKFLQIHSKNFKNKSLASKYSVLFRMPLSSQTASFLLDIVVDYSSLVRCVKESEQQNIIGPDFVKENTVSIGKSGR